jgi:hypothetical protein
VFNAIALSRCKMESHKSLREEAKAELKSLRKNRTEPRTNFQEIVLSQLAVRSS